MQWSRNWRVSHGRWLSKQGGALKEQLPCEGWVSKARPAFKSFQGWLLGLEKMSQTEKRVQPGRWFRDRNTSTGRTKTWQPSKKSRGNQSSTCMFLNCFYSCFLLINIKSSHSLLMLFTIWKKINLITDTKSKEYWFHNVTSQITNHLLSRELRNAQLGGSNSQQEWSKYHRILKEGRTWILDLHGTRQPIVWERITA